MHMEKNEIIGLIAVIAAVFAVIFIAAKVREANANPYEDIIVTPADEPEEEESDENDIWDVLHEMQETTAPVVEGDIVVVTAVDEDGNTYTVTDENGTPVTEFRPADGAAQDGNGATETETVQNQVQNDAPAESPVIEVSPDQQLPDPDSDDIPYFITAPAEE